MKLFQLFERLLFSLFILFTSNSIGQITTEYSLNLFPDTKTFDGTITICNNSPNTLAGGYTFKVMWPSVQSISYGLILNKSGADDCDTVALSTESWTPISAGACEVIDFGGTYEAPMFIPPKGVGADGQEVTLVHSASSYIPGSENGGSHTPEFYFDENCFIPSPAQLKVGEASLKEWGVKTDMYIPDNKKGWAISNAHAHALLTNLVGFEIVSPNHFNATALNESHCGCESDIIPDPASVNTPLSFQPVTVADGCFQVTPTGWLQLDQFFPDMVAGLSHASIISGNYARSCIMRAYYDATTLLHWEKVSCFDPLGMIQNTNDPYLAESLLGIAFYRGVDEDYFKTIFDTKRSTYLVSENVIQDAFDVGDVESGALNYGARQRNNTKQLDNNLTASWATNSQYYSPADFSWRGWYNDDINWSDFVAYFDEIDDMFLGVNWTSIAAEVKVVFDEINGGSAVPFTQLGPVIDKIVLLLPGYDGNKGMSVIYNSDILNCNKSSSISISSCSTLCPGEEGEITVNLMGTPPFNYSISGPNGEIYEQTNVLGSPVVLNVSDPGDYTVHEFSDANGSPFINCHFAHTTVNNSGTDDVYWDTTNVDIVDDCINGVLSLIGTGVGPWTIEYEHEGIDQGEIIFSSSPYEFAPERPHGTYKITRMVAGGCDSPNNSEVDVCLTVGQDEIDQFVKFFPNPVNRGDVLNVQSSEAIEFVLVYDSYGRLLDKRENTEKGNFTFNTSFLAKGVYYLSIISELGQQTTQQFVIK